MINAQWLHTFKVLVELGHFTKTAEALFMTQPGVSQHIQKLEAQLDTVLITKIGKKFELTDAGKKVYQYALRQHETEQRLKETIKVDSPYSGECLIAMSGSLCMQFQPIFLDRQFKHKELILSLEAAPNARIIDSVANNKIDFGIVTQKIERPQLEYKKIGYEELCLVVPASAHNTQWELDKLHALGLIDHPDCMHYLAQFIEEFERLKLNDIPKSGYTNQLSQILYPVAHGLGFTVLPFSAVNAFPLQDKIAVLPLAKKIKEPLYIVQKNHRVLPTRYNWFIKSIEESFSSTK